MEEDIQEFSELVGVPISTVVGIENGTIDDPPLSVVLSICNVLGISLFQFLSHYIDKIERSVLDRA
jgi:transcriptional regulator with XRE-family HTH domain